MIGCGAASACAARTCPTISAGRRLRTSPMRAVAQNSHPMPHPAWLEMQRVRRSRRVVGAIDDRDEHALDRGGADVPRRVAGEMEEQLAGPVLRVGDEGRCHP